MQLSDSPDKIVLPFAEDGGKNTIPVASQIGITPGAASYTDGFPPLTRTDIAAGGVPPAGLDINGILYPVSAISRWLNAGAGYIYDAIFAADSDVGGYPKGARICRSDGTGYWLNTIDNNAVDPESVTPGAAATAGWVPDTTNGTSSVAMTNANVTMTPAQYGKPVIVITGTLGANVNLIFPAIVGQWTVVNNTTGAFTITCKTASGTGIVLTQGASIIVYGDATNIYNASFGQISGVVGQARNLLMSVTTAAASATLTADEIIVESALGGVRYCLPSFSKTINLATTGAGGMDTGAAPASGFVAIYAIYNPTTNTAALLAKNAATLQTNVYSGANMPSGYTASALIGVWPTNGSSQFIAGYQIDRSLFFVAVSVLSTTTQQVSATSFSIATIIPVNAKSCRGNTTIVSTSSGSNLSYVIGASSTSIGTATGAITNSAANGGLSSAFPYIPLITAQTLYYAATSSAGTMTFSIGITGYKI